MTRRTILSSYVLTEKELSSRLTVVDAALQAGFPKEELFPRRGREINFIVNGRKRIARGDAGEAAIILVNGRP